MLEICFRRNSFSWLTQMRIIHNAHFPYNVRYFMSSTTENSLWDWGFAGVKLMKMHAMHQKNFQWGIKLFCPLNGDILCLFEIWEFTGYFVVPWIPPSRGVSSFLRQSIICISPYHNPDSLYFNDSIYFNYLLYFNDPLYSQLSPIFRSFSVFSSNYFQVVRNTR